MTTEQRVYVDFMKTDAKRRVVLTSMGTKRDLERFGIQLRDGLRLTVYSDDADDSGRPDNLVAQGVAQFDSTTNQWVLEVDWNAIRHESDLQPGES